jgi:hypothetical protein
MERALDGYESLADYAEWFLVKRLPGKEVAFEEVRMLLEKQGIHTRTPNAWGSLCNVLVRRGVLWDTGRTTHAVDPLSHACRVPVWRVSIL